MFYIKKDQDDRDAISLIEEVITAHKSLKKEKEKRVLDLYMESPNEKLFEQIYLEDEEIRNIDIQISGIEYARDYIKLMTKLSKK